MLHPEVTLTQFAGDARAAGLRVTDSGDWSGRTTFADVGALVGYFTLVPWDVPDDFGVDLYRDTLLALHARAEPLEFTSRRFWLRADKVTLD